MLHVDLDRPAVGADAELHRPDGAGGDDACRDAQFGVGDHHLPERLHRRDLEAERLGHDHRGAEERVARASDVAEYRVIRLRRLSVPHDVEHHLRARVTRIGERFPYDDPVAPERETGQEWRDDLTPEAGEQTEAEERARALGARGLDVASDVRVEGADVDERAPGGDHVDAGRQEGDDVSDALAAVFLDAAHVEHEVGIEIEHRVLVVGRDDPRSRHPAEVTGVLADLRGVVHPDADQLELGLLDHGTQREPARRTRRPLHDAGAHDSHDSRRSGTNRSGGR